MTDGAVKRAVSRAGLYSVGTIAQNLIGLLMLPVYTRFLTPEDYGVVAMLAIANSVVGLLFGMELVNGVLRHYFAAKTDRDRNAVFSTALIATGGLKLVAAICLAAAALPVSRALFGTEEHSIPVAIFAFTLFTQPLWFVPLQYLRALDRPVAFVAVSIIKLVLHLGLNIYLVAILELGVMGVVLSGVIGGIIMGVAMSSWTLSRTGLAFSVPTLRLLVDYSWPLVISAFIGLYVTMADKYFLRIFAGLEAVGLLALAQRLSQVLQTIIARSFNQYWGAERFRAYESNVDKSFYQQTFLLLVIVLVGCATALAVFATDVLWIMATPDFWSAAVLVAPLVAAVVVRQISNFCALGIYTSNKTRHFIWIGLVQAAVATVCFLTLVPRAGAQGAAWSAVIIALIRVAIVLPLGRRYFDMQVPWGRALPVISLGALTVLLATYTDPRSVFGLTERLGLYCAFVIALFYSPALSPDRRRAVLHFVLGKARGIRPLKR